MSKEKIVVFTGAGISAESGIETFRAVTGLWNNHNVMDVCHPEGWRANPELVLSFYNERRKNIQHAQPNAAHKAIAALEQHFEVVVITQNIDDLHERAGSSNVVHLHGEITKARSGDSPFCSKIYEIGYTPMSIGDKCEDGFQLRPHIVWFDETPFHLADAALHFAEAHRILIIGTSLKVYPAAALPDLATKANEKVLVDNAVNPEIPYGFQLNKGQASDVVPKIAADWISLVSS